MWWQDRRYWIPVIPRQNEIPWTTINCLWFKWFRFKNSPKNFQFSILAASVCVCQLSVGGTVVTGDGGYWCNSHQTYPTSKWFSEDFLDKNNSQKNFPFYFLVGSVNFPWARVVTGDGGYWFSGHHMSSISKWLRKDFWGEKTFNFLWFNLNFKSLIWASRNLRKTFHFYSW